MNILMKKIYALIVILFFSLKLFSQVIIGQNSNLNIPNLNSSISLKFIGNRGIVLPWVTSTAAMVAPVNGTLIYDTSDFKVKWRVDNVCVDLSVDNTGNADTSLQTTLTEMPSAKVAIGVDGAIDTTQGILVLTDTNKAMILPKMISPHLNIINPSSGMIAYDTNKHQLAVFNGSVWSFWKP